MDMNFSGFSRKPLFSEDRKQTGKIPPGEKVTIHVTVPPHAREMSIRAAQIQSDADLRLEFEGTVKKDTHGPSFKVEHPAAREWVAVLSADREVTDCNVTVIVQVQDRPSDH